MENSGKNSEDSDGQDFRKKHTSSAGKKPKYEIQEEILYQFLTLLIEI